MKSDSVFIDLLFAVLKTIGRAFLLTLYLAGRIIQFIITNLNLWIETLLK